MILKTTQLSTHCPVRHCLAGLSETTENEEQ